MNSKPGRPTLDELKRLEIIADELNRLANAAMQKWHDAVVRAEGTPLLDVARGKH